jgi:hypothetical protein
VYFFGHEDLKLLMSVGTDHFSVVVAYRLAIRPKNSDEDWGEEIGSVFLGFKRNLVSEIS